jgi:hypothetical protein
MATNQKVLFILGSLLVITSSCRREVREIPRLGLVVAGDSLLVGKTSLEEACDILHYRQTKDPIATDCSIVDSSWRRLRDTTWYEHAIVYRAYYMYFEGHEPQRMRLISVKKLRPGRDKWGKHLPPLPIAAYNKAPRRPLIGYCLCHHE